ncbi:allantoate deiminase [Limosilactobacillus fermentum]|uniref:allantoate deiminase n=1 Tax=Limosilactobacillus fermentum TaxID=1613 RepID=UPI000BFF1543|nr:allantoate deiminase [Limosilactobacillus fermentum]PHI33114.1 allantoate amidohydrolase [Limosilactobacillus fermentum]
MELAPTVKHRLDQLSSIGSDPTGGLTRLLYSDEWLTAQKYVQEEMTAMGMTTKFDGVGNLFGRIEGKDLPNETVMTGSHIDTVVNGGNLDGQFGVLASLTAVEYLKEKYGQPKRSLEVISMAEEEGSRFPTVFWGSKNFVGIADNEEVKDIKDGQGKGFVDEMHRQGFDFQEQTRRDDIVAFVEEHIEQGSILETEGDQIGVVTSIAGQRRYNITLKGQANHAGTTPMSYRHDAVYGIAKIVTLALERAHEIGDPLVMTFGKVVPKPNTVNVVPGEVLFTMDCRHTDPDFLIEFSTQIEEMMKEVAQDMGLGIEIDRWMDEAPVPMSEKVYQTIENCAKSGGYKYRVMYSGAGHDSQIIAPVYPTAMIFVPSIGGISHNPAEETSFEDLVNGVQLLADTLYELAYK